MSYQGENAFKGRYSDAPALAKCDPRIRLGDVSSEILGEMNEKIRVL